MSNVASKELCERLYELSGWQTKQFVIVVNLGMPSAYTQLIDADQNELMENYESSYPAYDLGYMLRKLPQGAYLSKGKAHYAASTGNFRSGSYGFPITEHGDTPEDAAAKLVIELFEQGVLIK